MKELTIGTQSVPAPRTSVGESVNALTEQVNNLQRKYYRALAPDLEIKTESDNGISVPSAGRAPAWCSRRWSSLSHCAFIRQRKGKGVKYD